MNLSRRKFLQFAGTTFAVFATSPAAVLARPSKLISIPEPAHPWSEESEAKHQWYKCKLDVVYTVPQGHTFHVEGLDQNWEPVSENITLTGTTPTETVQVYSNVSFNGGGPKFMEVGPRNMGIINTRK